MRYAIHLAALALLVAGCGDGEGIHDPEVAVQAGVSESHTNSTPVDFVAVNPCNEDEIHFTGFVNQRFDLKFDGKGGLRLSAHINSQGVSGVALNSGTTYRGVGADQEHLKVKPGSAEVLTVNGTMHFVGKGGGSADNFRQHFLIHITINANGTMTSEIERTTISCD